MPAYRLVLTAYGFPHNIELVPGIGWDSDAETKMAMSVEPRRLRSDAREIIIDGGKEATAVIQASPREEDDYDSDIPWYTILESGEQLFSTGNNSRRWANFTILMHSANNIVIRVTDMHIATQCFLINRWMTPLAAAKQSLRRMANNLDVHLPREIAFYQAEVDRLRAAYAQGMANRQAVTDELEKQIATLEDSLTTAMLGYPKISK